MGKKNKHTPAPWQTYFTEHSHTPGWQVKAAHGAEVPIAIVPEPMGGKKGADGRSEIQAANAKLITASPDMLEALEYAGEVLNVLKWQGGTIEKAHGLVLKAIEKAKGGEA